MLKHLSNKKNCNITSWSLILLLCLALGAGTHILAPGLVQAEAADEVSDTVEDFYIPEDYSEEDFLAARARSIGELSAEEKVKDYTCFWDILENSYPMLDYLKRKGAEPEALKAKYAEAVKNVQTAEDWQAFFSQIVAELVGYPYAEVGHLSVVNFGNRLLNADYQTYTYLIDEFPDDPWIHMMGSVFNNPHVVGYYDLIKEKREKGDAEPFIDIPNNLYVEHHPEANWSYILISSFLNQNPQDVEIIREFFETAEELEISNVIIDLRNNSGGYNDYWLNYLVSPNITKPLQIENFGLYKKSHWNKDYLNYYAGSTFEEDLAEMKEQGELPSLIFSWNQRETPLPKMPALVKEDVANLKEVFQETIRIAPAADEQLYTGKFWILAGAGSYSASEYFLSFAKRTGFAKIVGEESGGDGSCVVTIYNALPESGLVLRYNTLYGLNPDGSPNEESATQPDYEVAEGEDALAHTLNLIQEEG